MQQQQCGGRMHANWALCRSQEMVLSLWLVQPLPKGASTPIKDDTLHVC